ncbi:hypothetical protein AA0488_1264 [Kozakia baliensis NRIC 0488]|nr:hypothetical protein AA0488_1264 [Kozakia baliensis NRIC 0488]GEL65360.1 hypothetical protein KBA01_26460 [Kozakia baliensis]
MERAETAKAKGTRLDRKPALPDDAIAQARRLKAQGSRLKAQGCQRER